MHRIIGYSLFGAAVLLAGPEPAAARNPTCSDRAPAVIDDFEDGDVTTLDGFGRWYITNDGTGIQLPRDIAQLVVAGGPGDSERAAQTSGVGFTDWGAVVGVGFACPRSVEDFEGFRFAIQGAAPIAFEAKVITLATQSEENGGECSEGCNDHFAAPLALADGRWYECSVRFDDLAQRCFGTPTELALDEVTGVELFYPANAAFDVTFDDLRFERRVSQTGCVAIEPPLECQAD